MKKLLLLIPFVFVGTLHSDTRTTNEPYLIIQTTGAIDKTRSWADKYNDNFKIISATISTNSSDISGLKTSTASLDSRTTAVELEVDALNSGQINASSYTLQGNSVNISTIAQGINSLYQGQINASSYTLQGNSVNISTVAQGVNQIMHGWINGTSTGSTFVLLDGSTQTKKGGFKIGGALTIGGDGVIVNDSVSTSKGSLYLRTVGNASGAAGISSAEGFDLQFNGKNVIGSGVGKNYFYNHVILVDGKFGIGSVPTIPSSNFDMVGGSLTVRGSGSGILSEGGFYGGNSTFTKVFVDGVNISTVVSGYNDFVQAVNFSTGITISSSNLYHTRTSSICFVIGERPSQIVFGASSVTVYITSATGSGGGSMGGGSGGSVGIYNGTTYVGGSSSLTFINARIVFENSMATITYVGLDSSNTFTAGQVIDGTLAVTKDVELQGGTTFLKNVLMSGNTNQITGPIFSVTHDGSRPYGVRFYQNTSGGKDRLDFTLGADAYNDSSKGMALLRTGTNTPLVIFKRLSGQSNDEGFTDFTSSATFRKTTNFEGEVFAVSATITGLVNFSSVPIRGLPLPDGTWISSAPWSEFNASSQTITDLTVGSIHGDGSGLSGISGGVSLPFPGGATNYCTTDATSTVTSATTFNSSTTFTSTVTVIPISGRFFNNDNVFKVLGDTFTIRNNGRLFAGIPTPDSSDWFHFASKDGSMEGDDLGFHIENLSTKNGADAFLQIESNSTAGHAAYGKYSIGGQTNMIWGYWMDASSRVNFGLTDNTPGASVPWIVARKDGGAGTGKPPFVGIYTSLPIARFQVAHGTIAVTGNNAAIYIGTNSLGGVYGTPTNGVILFSTYVADTQTSELYVLDSAGNMTQISPHASLPPILDPYPEILNPMVLLSRNGYAGTEDRINLSAMAKLLQDWAHQTSKLPDDKFLIISSTFPIAETWDAKEQRLYDADNSYVKQAKPERIRRAGK